MRGHDAIVAMRLKGKRPAIVFVNDYPCDEHDWAAHGDHATVCTHGDAIELLDLRFLIGCMVSISSTSEARARALFEAARKAGADVVGACHVNPAKREFEQDGWCEVWVRGRGQAQVAQQAAATEA